MSGKSKKSVRRCSCGRAEYGEHITVSCVSSASVSAFDASIATRS